jgi:hypothetical protein
MSGSKTGMRLGRAYATGSVALLVSGYVLAAAVATDTSPPTLDEAISRAPAAWRATSSPVDGLTLGETHIEFEKTTLSDIRGSVKSGVIRHQGDAGKSVYWLCYSGVGTPEGVDDPGAMTNNGANIGGARIWIESSGEMGGPDHAVTTVVVKRIPKSDPTAECPEPSKEFRSLTFANGLRLGATRASLESQFAGVLVNRGNQSFIGYQSKVVGDGKCDGEFDRLNSLVLVFQSDKLESIYANQVTSC